MKKLALITAILAMGAIGAQATITSIDLQLNRNLGAPDNSVSSLGTIAITTLNAGSAGGAVQSIIYTVTGLTLDSVGTADDEITFTMGLTGTSTSGTVLGLGASYGAWGVADGTGLASLVDDDEALEFSFIGATVTLGAGATEVATIDYNGITGFSALNVNASEPFDVTGTASNNVVNGTISGNNVPYDFTGPETAFTVEQKVGGVRYHRIQTSVTITTAPGPRLNEFTGTVDDAWANSANWVNTVPSAGLGAIVNSNLTANLSTGPGNAEYLYVGTIDSQSGTVSNGSVTVVNGTRIGTGSNAVGVVELTAYTAGTASYDVSIGTGEFSSGSLVAGGSGTLTAKALTLASGENSIGTLSIPSMDLSANSTIGSGTSSSGTVAVTSLNMNSQKMTLAGGRDSYASLTLAGATTMGQLTMGTGSNSVAVIDVPVLTSVGNVYTSVGRASTISLLSDTHTMSGGANYNVGQTRDSSATIEGSTGAGTTLDFTGSAGSQFLVNRGSNSVSTFTLTAPIAMDSTNKLEIGTGLDSSHNLTESDFSITGPIGDFFFGDGTGVLTNLFNTHDSIGALTVNVPAEITGTSNHVVEALTVNADLGGGANATLESGALVAIASTADSDVTFDMTDWISAGVTSGPITVATGADAVGDLTASDLIADEMQVAVGADSTGTLDLADLTLTSGGTFQVASGSGSFATVDLDSLVSVSTNSDLSVATSGASATGTVTVAGNVVMNSLRLAIGADTVGTLTASTMLFDLYFNIATVSNSHATVSATTLDRLGYAGFQVAEGQDSYASVTADNGTVTAGLNNGFNLASGINSMGIVAVTNGTLDINAKVGRTGMRVATGSNSTATVLFGTINISGATQDVNIATGDDSSATVTSGGGSMIAADVNIGSANSGVGTLVLNGGDLVVIGALEIATGSYIDITDSSSSLKWDGVYEDLWNAGALRSNGTTGPDNAFVEYFTVVDGVLIETPISFIAIANAVSGIDISFQSSPGWSYDVKTNVNLVYQSWGTQATVSGDGTVKTVNVPATGAAVFYEVIATPAP